MSMSILLIAYWWRYLCL